MNMPISGVSPAIASTSMLELMPLGIVPPFAKISLVACTTGGTFFGQM
jgi:hypothetical protein